MLRKKGDEMEEDQEGMEEWEAVDGMDEVDCCSCYCSLSE